MNVKLSKDEGYSRIYRGVGKENQCTTFSRWMNFHNIFGYLKQLLYICQMKLIKELTNDSNGETCNKKI